MSCAVSMDKMESKRRPDYLKETYYSIPGCLLSFALLTDMHNKPMTTVIASLRTHKPQAILIAGDIIYGGYHGESLVTKAEINVLPALTAFASIAPTFLSLGNHERILCEEDYELIRETGVSILDNEWIEQGNSGYKT